MNACIPRHGKAIGEAKRQLDVADQELQGHLGQTQHLSFVLDVQPGPALVLIQMGLMLAGLNHQPGCQ